MTARTDIINGAVTKAQKAQSGLKRLKVTGSIEMTNDYEPFLSIFKNPEDGDLHLAPCPFCGGTDIIYWEYGALVGPRWKIFCLGCAAGVDPGYAQQKHQITDIWNTRAGGTGDC
jgi:Lar family restriction alleviation protein